MEKVKLNEIKRNKILSNGLLTGIYRIYWIETKSFECRIAIKGIDERTAQQHESI